MPTCIQARPIWLAALLEQPSWRRTFYALADDHPNSLVLDYALRRIAADPMLHAELVDAGGIAASYLSLAAFECALVVSERASCAPPHSAAQQSSRSECKPSHRLWQRTVAMNVRQTLLSVR